MKNLRIISLAILYFSCRPMFAQTAPPEPQADFSFTDESQGIRFQPVMPPLTQKAGAPAAYYTYFWEFGDGAFSREDQPLHRFGGPGDYMVSVDATAHYDNGKKAKKKKTKVANTHSEAYTAVSMPDVFDEKGKQAIAMATNAMPRAGEEMTVVISYRNNGFLNTNGRLHLFFNEKKYKSPHFDFVEARTHFGETADPLISQVLPTHTLPTSEWTSLSTRSSTGASASWTVDFTAFSILQDMLNNARSAYREEKAWRFTDLDAGAKRNLFVSLAGTADMLKDTSAFIHLEAVFAPDDPAVAPERFEMEVEIVASHDPNVIAVSDNRVSYRTVGDKKLDYKVRFQNNGEGPASMVELKVEIPEGLDMAAMRPVEWYPACPICPKTPVDYSCLDTASSKNGLSFTFRNIYLPGSRQKDVGDRDSTKGFVKYRIEAGKDMPKRSFRSRAKITFDKNPPIYTNFTKTRFKPGIS
ncbi:MAG TPA: PKD domain-containing protein, partial [Saprospiraceae bacterium]|nr:PKD domain-containing protein [Saprospiraceae bacterium]